MFYDKFFIPNQAGRRLACLLFVPQEKPRFQMVVSHGFRGRKENSGRLDEFAEKIIHHSGRLLAFDFAGSGESEGSFSEMSLSSQVEDLQAVVEFALEKDDSPLILLGRSFGGSTSLAAAAADERVSGLVLWSTPVLLEDTFFSGARYHMQSLLAGGSIDLEDEGGSFQIGPQFARDLSRHDFDRYLNNMKERPVLVIHGERDQDVGLQNVRFIEKRAGQTFEIHVVSGADHRFSEHQPIRENLTLNWLDRNFK